MERCGRDDDTPRLRYDDRFQDKGRHSRVGANLKAYCITIPNQVGNDDPAEYINSLKSTAIDISLIQ